jgi:hypothetical protein
LRSDIQGLEKGDVPLFMQKSITLLLDGSSYSSEVFAECVGRIGRTFIQVFVKPKLFTKLPSLAYQLSLSSLGLPNSLGSRRKLFSILSWSENNSIMVSENNVLPSHLKIAKMG